MKFPLIAALSILILIAATLILLRFDVETRVFPPNARLPDGAEYHGDIQNAKLHGNGKLVWPNGDRYVGELRNGAMSGYGELTMVSGDFYEGEFRNGMIHGTGTYEAASGDIYKGEFKDDYMDGYGIYTDVVGNVYSGEFVKSAFSGKGTFTDTAGNRYAGEFDYWRMHGLGEYTLASGDIYRGEFVRGAFSGRGTHITAAGEKYRGMFQDGVLHGRGLYKGVDGERYEGDFQHGVYHGRGTLIDKQANRYEGQFKYGYKHGKGTLLYAGSDEEDRPEKRSGRWQYGRFVDPEEEGKAAVLRNNVETALYNQNRLLDESLSQVATGTPGEIELYFLGVAGYSDQDVFNEELRYIDEVMSQNHGTRGRSLRLVNHRESMHDRPLATRVAFEKALSGLADKMNTDEDILFVYMTSHGSEDHKLSLQQEGLLLPDLDARYLGELFDSVPIKWKVTMISACYSGGFIPFLENDNTLVMTAAGEDRRSFGCSDQSEMTYFGKAYFREALPSSSSFVEAFERAKKVVREWEDDEIEENSENGHSEPQISSGQGILRKLRAWRKQRNTVANR